MKYRTMNQGVDATCATCNDTGWAWPRNLPDIGVRCTACDPTCGTEDNPHQWAQVPHPDDTCGRCQREYKACGTAWHEVGR